MLGCKPFRAYVVVRHVTRTTVALYFIAQGEKSCRRCRCPPRVEATHCTCTCTHTRTRARAPLALAPSPPPKQVADELVASDMVNARNLAQLLWSLAKLGNPKVSVGQVRRHPEAGLPEIGPLKFGASGAVDTPEQVSVHSRVFVLCYHSVCF